MATEITPQLRYASMPISGHDRYEQSAPPFGPPNEKKGPYISVEQQGPPQLQQRSLITRWRSFAYRTWVVESIAVFVAFVFNAAIFAVCAIYHNHPINATTEGPFTTPPTSTLNILVSVMRTAILLAVASGIAQLKWTWYKKPNSLADMEYFDEAARGVVGALQFIRRPRLW
jgi:Protein of unknown function (DUF3176)